VILISGSTTKGALALEVRLRGERDGVSVLVDVLEKLRRERQVFRAEVRPHDIGETEHAPQVVRLRMRDLGVGAGLHRGSYDLQIRV